MKLLDAIRNVLIPEDAYRDDWSYTAPDEPICRALGIENCYFYPEAVRRSFKAFPIFNWICTDEHVGLDALYLNGEPVGCSYRPARKSDYEIEWISKEAAAKVREFILSHMERPEFTLLDPDQDIGEDFAVHYVGQNLRTDGTFEGRPVTVTGGYDIMGRSGMNITYADERYNKFIVDDAGTERLVEPQELRFAFNLREPAA